MAGREATQRRGGRATTRIDIDDVDEEVEEMDIDTHGQVSNVDARKRVSTLTAYLGTNDSEDELAA